MIYRLYSTPTRSPASTSSIQVETGDDLLTIFDPYSVTSQYIVHSSGNRDNLLTIFYPHSVIVGTSSIQVETGDDLLTIFDPHSATRQYVIYPSRNRG
jgi:hypothetical protein